MSQRLRGALRRPKVCSNPAQAISAGVTSLTPFSQPRAGKGTCGIGLGRESGSVLWDVTVYNVAQPFRQDINVVATLKNAHMDKGQTITVPNPIGDITISNVDNAPVFPYILGDLKAPLDDPWEGKTRVKLNFEMKSAGLKWSTDDCGPGSVIFSAGRESWTCDFPCSVSATREL